MPRLLLLLSLFVLSGCPARRITFGPEGEVRSVTALLRLTDQAEAQVASVKGEAKIHLESPQQRGASSLFVAVHHPALLHLEALDFFGKPRAVLVTDGQRFGLFQADEGRYYQGPASAENVSRLLPVALPPEELTALLLGRAPRLPADGGTLSLDHQARMYRVALRQGEVTQTLWIDPASHRVRRSEVRGARAYDVRFDELQTQGAVSWPRKVLLATGPGNATQVTLDYRDITLNAPPDLTLFEPAPPVNVPLVEVDARGVPVR